MADTPQHEQGKIETKSDLTSALPAVESPSISPAMTEPVAESQPASEPPAVALVEPQSPQVLPTGEAWDNRIYAISPGNAEFLESLGAWMRLDPQRVQRGEGLTLIG